VQAHLHLRDPEMSELRVAETFAGLRYGQPIQTAENIEAMARGDRFRVYTSEERGELGAADWRNKNAFRPRADDLRHKLRRFRTASIDDPDRRWLAAMTLCWSICLQGDQGKESRAEYLADQAAEREYFEEIMRPLLNDRVKQREAGLTRADVRLPDFLRIFFPTT
jgi:hypothetical protein